MTPKIIIFSSTSIDLENAKKLFEREGFDVFTYVEVNETNINNIYKINPDIIFLDVEIVNSDGIELCYQFKSEKILNSFVILFTKHGEEYIQLEAYKAGADDYIVKPINARLLIKKIQALLKRKPLNRVNNTPKIITHNTLKIDRESYVIFKDGKRIALPRKEFEMLYLLINQPKKVFSREEIFESVWKDTTKKNTRSIDVHIRKIREQVGQKIIKTVKGVGYQLA